jgi:hypothetical protein
MKLFKIIGSLGGLKMVGLNFLTFSENFSNLIIFVDSIEPCLASG